MVAGVVEGGGDSMGQEQVGVFFHCVHLSPPLRSLGSQESRSKSRAGLVSSEAVVRGAIGVGSSIRVGGQAPQPGSATDTPLFA